MNKAKSPYAQAQSFFRLSCRKTLATTKFATKSAIKPSMIPGAPYKSG